MALRLSTAIVAIICLVAPLAGASHRLRVYPNSAITILAIAEGPDRLLWLAAEDGLYRFDGLHYHKIPDFPFASARFLAFTSDGSLWAAGHEGLVRYKNRFEVILRDSVENMAARPDRVFLRTNQLVSIDLSGSVLYPGVKPRADLMLDHSGRLWFVGMNPYRAASIGQSGLEYHETL